MIRHGWLTTLRATFSRELAEHRLNRFLHVHLALSATIGLLPLFTPDEAARAAPLWVLQGVLYCLSLSALLLGLSAAHGDLEESAMLFTQPVGCGTWLAGKAAALAAMLAPASLLLIAPTALTSGATWALLAMALAAGGVCVGMALLGLAAGIWIRDHVRGLLAALGLWFLLLFGTDLVLLAVAGAPWAQAHQDAWALPMMLNPLAALRVTVLFGLERVAPAGVGATPLIAWWLAHGGLWLSALLAAWIAAAFAASVAGARRRLDA
jgi:Cu-processing system permease protein